MDEYRGEKVLITGGLGFIGSNVAIRLVESGASVTLLDSIHPTCGANYFNIETIKNDVEIVVGDSSNLELVRKLVRGQAWTVFGVLVCVLLIMIVAAVIAGIIGAAIGGVAGAIIVGIIVLALFMPISALVASTLFFDLGGGGALPDSHSAV